MPESMNENSTRVTVDQLMPETADEDTEDLTIVSASEWSATSRGRAALSPKYAARAARLIQVMPDFAEIVVTHLNQKAQGWERERTRQALRKRGYGLETRVHDDDERGRVLCLRAIPLDAKDGATNGVDA